MHYTDENVVSLASVLSTLGDPTRLSIVVFLLDKKATVSEITIHMGMSQPAISHHLKLLKEMKILKNEKKGKHVFYSLDDDHVKDIIEVGLIHTAHGE